MPVGAHAAVRRQHRQAARDRRRRRRHADRGAEPGGGARNLSAVLAIGRVLEASRRPRRRRSRGARRARAHASCARSIRRPPSSGSRRWRRSGASRWRRERSRCGCSSASPSSRRCWRSSGSTASCRCRSTRGSRRLRCGRPIGAQRHQIVQLIVGEGSKLVAGGLVLGAIAGGAGRPAAADAALRRQAVGSDRARRRRRSPSASSRSRPACCPRFAPAAST